MKFPINKKLAALPPSGIRKFFEIVAEKPNVISLSVGEPDFAAPWHVREHAIFALEKGETHYSANRGTTRLLNEIAAYHRRRFGVRRDPQTEILVTNGASEGFDLSVRTILEAGDEVLIPSPSYVMYSPLVELAGGIPIAVKSGANGKISAMAVVKKITPKTKAIVLNFPANPTGATFRKSELEKIAALAEEKNLVVISDEIYAELTYENSHVEFASLPKMRARTITLSGCSKAWAMTGFRIGWLAGPADFIAAATKIHQYSALCACRVGQAAATEALRNGDAAVAEMRDEYRARRDFIFRELIKIGFEVARPAGAFYIFPNVRKLTKMSGDEFALRLLDSEEVAVVPGSAFGQNLDDFIRISFATGFDELREALARIAKFVAKI